MQTRKRAGLVGNDNAWKNRRATYKRLAPQPTISGKELESFMAKLSAELGHEATEQEARAKAKALFDAAIACYNRESL